MHASANTYVDVIPQIYLYFLSPSRAQRRSHHPTTTRVPLTALWPRVRLRDGVPQQKCPYLFNAHRSHRRPPHGSRRPPTPPMRDPTNPCTSRAEPWATTTGPRVPPSHYRPGVTRMQIYAPLRTPSTSHRCTPRARHSTTRPSPPHAHACEPERRRTHRSPSTPQPTPLPNRPNRTHSTFLPAALYKTPSIPTHRSPRTQNPPSGAAPRVGAASPALPYGGGAQ
jgi:hypothetical protein